MAHQLFQLPKPTAISANLTLLPGAKVEFFLTTTTTPTPVYTTSALSTPHANPVVADSAGRLPPIYLDPSILYRITFKDSAGAEIYPAVDPVNDQLLSQAIIGAYLYPRTAAEIAAGVTPVNYAGTPNWVTRYGALADKTTDDLAAFNTAAAVAVYSKRIHIPPCRAGYYYKLSNVWTLADLDNVEVSGEGIQSLLVIANAAGANCIALNSTVHATLRNFGIYGTAGSGNGLEVLNDSHYNSFEDIWCGWVDGDAFKNTLGISNTYINCKADQNNGFRPATLAGGLTDGSIKRGFYVPSTATGRNNNPTFVGCQVNAAGETMSVQIGDTGGTAIESFNWHGGLIQGSSTYRELYLVTKNAVIQGTHIESSFVGAQSNWGATLDACDNTVIRDCELNADVRMIGACRNSGIESALTFGVNIGASCDRSFIRDASYGNVTTGPSGGLVIDRGSRTDLRRLTSNNDRYAVGHHLDNPTTYFQTNMEQWVGTSVPCGFTSFGTPTITRDTSVVRSGTYSAKVVHSSELDEGLTITMLPVNMLAGRQITIEAWVYNLATAGLGYISMVEGGTGVSVHQQSFQADGWERMLITFRPNASATSIAIRLNGLIGTVYWDSVKITVDEHTPVTSMTLDGTATPSISYGGYHVPLLITSGTPTITGFLHPHEGKPFTILFAGATVITDGDPIFLAGAGNFTGAAGGTMTLVFSGGSFYQISESVL